MKKQPFNIYYQNSLKYGWGIENKIPEYKINELLPHILGNKVLDIGCGPGHFVNILSQKGYNAFGIDPVKEFIDFAQKNQSGHFQIGTAYKLPFKNKEFDTIILKSVLEHLEDDETAMKEALRVGKRLIVIVPQKTPKVLKEKGLIYSHYQDKTHLRNYTKKSLTRLINLSEAKLKNIIEIEKLPNISIFINLFDAPKFVKKVITKIFFIIFKEKHYYLELLAIIESC